MQHHQYSKLNNTV